MDKMAIDQEALMLRAEMDKQGVTQPALRAAIAAIAMGESAFSMKPEMGYAHTENQRIRLIFRNRVADLRDDQLNQLKADPVAFFNRVYGGSFGAKELGNTEPGDGFKFRGRGMFQLTGRANYDRYGRLIGRDLLTDPEVADDPAVACAVAVAYMRDRYHGGGWEAMKRAVGFNVSDIASMKDRLFAQYFASGEFGPLPSGGVLPTSDLTLAMPSGAAVLVRSAIDRVKSIQTILQEGGLYKGQIDGQMGPGSYQALGLLVHQAVRG